MSPNSPITNLDYFSGGVPAGALFQINVENLREIVAVANVNSAAVCLVGLLAYFEAFFKDHFASIINIQPQMLENLKKGEFDTSIDANDIIGLGNNSEFRLGSLLAEKYDFGTAKRINSIFQSLLMVTPFSKDEISHYDQLLNDRNLIVHHGGIYTLRYVRQKFGIEKGETNAYWDSLVVTNETFLEAAIFCEAIVKKTIKSTKTALSNYVEKNAIIQSQENKGALDFLDLWLKYEN
jgi:hypothetical protein